MIFFRGLVLLLFSIGLGCLGAYLYTGEKRYQRLAIQIVKWTIVAALVFFAVLIAEQLATKF